MFHLLSPKRLQFSLPRIVAPLPSDTRRFLAHVFFSLFNVPPRTMRTAEGLEGLRSLIDFVSGQTSRSGLRMVELGCYAGESTLPFAKHFSSVIAVDPWRGMPHVEAAFTEKLRPFPHVVKMKRTSAQAAGDIADASLDFVYIDADHSFESVTEDIQLWLPKLKPGSFIGGHDYRETDPGVVRAVDEVLGPPDRVFLDWSWVHRISN